MRTKIYMLKDQDGRIRYIGKTSSSLKERLLDHLSHARRGCKDRKCCWIRFLFKQGFIPKIQLIGEVDGNGIREEIAWIAYFRAEGIDLVNGTAGGEGVVGYKYSDEERRQMSIARCGRKQSAEAIENHRIAMMGHKVSEATRMKIRMANVGRFVGRKLSEETCKKLSLFQKGRKKSEEHKRKIGLGNKGKLLGRKRSAESIRKTVLANTGAKRSVKGIRNMVEAWKLRKLKKVA